MELFGYSITPWSFGQTQHFLTNFFLNYKYIVISAGVILISTVSYWRRRWIVPIFVHTVERVLAFWKYFGPLTRDLFVSVALIYGGYKLYETIHHTGITIGLIVTTVVVLLAKLKRYQKHSLGSASEISVMNQNRSDYGAALKKFNELRPPYQKVMSFSESRLIEKIISDQIKLLEKRLRLYFGLGSREDFSASLLFYNPLEQKWYKWKTVHRNGEKEGNKSIGWPKKRSDFKLRDSLYHKSFDESPYETHDLCGEDYNSVLSIPFYFPQKAMSGAYKEGDIFAMLSYATNKRNFFSKLDNLNFLWFFLLESAIIERASYRILKSYYDKPKSRKPKD